MRLKLQNLFTEPAARLISKPREHETHPEGTSPEGDASSLRIEGMLCGL